MLRARVSRLERAIQTEEPLPYVVRYESGETPEEAIERVLGGRVPPAGWRFVLAPQPMSLEAWEVANSPQHPQPPENPN